MRTEWIRRSRTVAMGIAASIIAPAVSAQQLAGWSTVTSDKEYVVQADAARRDGGQGSTGAMISSVVDDPSGTGVLAQSIRADNYRGKRVRLSGYLKTADVNGGVAALWMRVDGDGATLCSDYMTDRVLRGTTDWTRQEIVLDVPDQAVGITFGFLLDGGGRAWLDEVALEIVDETVKVTGQSGGLYRDRAKSVAPRELARRKREQIASYRNAPAQPVNLSFGRSGRAVGNVAMQ